MLINEQVIETILRIMLSGIIVFTVAWIVRQFFIWKSHIESDVSFNSRLLDELIEKFREHKQGLELEKQLMFDIAMQLIHPQGSITNYEMGVKLLDIIDRLDNKKVL